MFKSLVICAALAIGTLSAQEQITINKVTINTPSGVITGKVVGQGENLVFVDDANPSKSFTLERGQVKSFTTEGGNLMVQMARPETDAAGTVSNVKITVLDQANSGVLTKWFNMPQERSRTVTTFSTEVKHDHRDDHTDCTGRLLADDTGLRFESVSNASHSKSWNYNDLQSFVGEKENSLLKVMSKNGENYHFKTVNGKTAGGLYDIVSKKIVAARPSGQQ
jgi:hypothetical protein